MSKKKKKKINTHIYFSLLLLIGFLLTVSLGFLIVKQTYSETGQDIEYKKEFNISNIEKPSYAFPDINVDTDLPKFPSDYDTLVGTLGISLSQHQKTTLLLYGESIFKTEYTNITDAYSKLIELNIPILIPQEYINGYVDEIVKEYSSEIGANIEQLNIPLTVKKDTFNNVYEEYIYNQMQIQLQQEFIETVVTEQIPNISFLLVDIDSESFNNGYYKILILKEYEKEVDELENLFKEILLTTQSTPSPIEKLGQYIYPVLSNINLNKPGNVYWKISVIGGKSYVHPVYITEEYVVNDNNFNDPYDMPPVPQSTGTTRVPILMYHQIDEIPSGSSFTQGLYVTPEVFEEQLAYLVKRNYKSISPEELYTLLESRQNPLQKSVMITFDDSKSSQYRNGYPLLKKYGLNGIYYVVSSKTSITYSQLKDMAQNGMIIGSHSATHIDLAKEGDAQRLYSEIVGSRYSLKNSIGQSVSSIAYPGCVIDGDGYPYVNQAGYLIGVSCGRSIDHTLKKRLTLSRVHVFSSVENLKNLLSGIN